MGEGQLTSTARVEGFSDGVIAIIITIMILEFRLPENALDQGIWLGVIKPTVPKIMSYALSFLLLTNMWIGHHALMHSARYATPTLMWTNNNLLFWMSMVPFATMILGDHPLTPAAVALYGGSLAACAISFTFLRWRVIMENEFRGDAFHIQRAGLRRAVASTSIYLAAIPLAFVSVYISLALFVASPLMFFIWHIWLTRKLLVGHQAFRKSKPSKKI
jgi:uncharacterized membrane protein